MSRRVALFASLFINLERFVTFGEDGKNLTPPLSIKQKLYFYHISMYQHQMNRMINWILSTKYLWPSIDTVTYDKDQPIYALIFDSLFKKLDSLNFILRYPVQLLIDRLFVNLNSFSEHNHLRLLNPVDAEETALYFHFTGPEAFTLQKEENPRSTCALSSILIILQSFHDRLLNLEKCYNY